MNDLTAMVYLNVVIGWVVWMEWFAYTMPGYPLVAAGTLLSGLSGANRYGD